MIKTLGFGQIDWTGFKSVLIHTLIGAILTIVLSFVQTLSHANFGVYASIALPIFVFVVAFIKKLAETYSVTIDDSSTPSQPSSSTSTTTS